MMTTLAQTHPPYPGMQQHPGMPPHMAGVSHNQPGQPGPGMPQQMHMVSGPGGPQVTQAGTMMGVMPPGAGGPNAHALQHLNPGQQQAHMFQQQQQAQAQLYANANNPSLQAQHQQIMARQALNRQAAMAQQYNGMPVNMLNGMGQINAAQFQAMRAAQMGRPVNPVSLPQHLQQQQQQVSQSAEQHMAQQHHQQMAIQQQMAMQQQQQAQGGQGPQGHMGPQQIHNLQQAQLAHQQHQQQQQQAAQAQAAAQQAQAQGQGQSSTSQPPPNPQNPAQQVQGQQPQPGMQQQHLMQARAAERLKGQCMMRLFLLGDHLSGFTAASKPLQTYLANEPNPVIAQRMKQRVDNEYWMIFVDRFFSTKGVLRHSVWIVDETSNKQYEIPYPALARYFFTHFESGVRNMQLMIEKGSEKELPNSAHFVESQKSSFIYWFENGSQLIATGTLRAHFDSEQKIELLEFITNHHGEFVPRTRVLNAARPLHEWQKEWHRINSMPDGKPSPEMNKKKPKTVRSPAQPPPEIDLPDSMVKSSMGITQSVFRFLELAEVIGQMQPLLDFARTNPTLAPYAALEQYVTSVASNAQNPPGPRTPGLPNFPLGASPAAAHLSLPDGSPHTLGGSPAQAPGMQLQQSQHGTSSSGPSANTSPNVNNKRRRPSGVKEEDIQINGTQKPNVKPSPRIGGKRQKGNPA